MTKTLITTTFALFAIFASTLSAAEAGSSSDTCWAGYKYGDAYPCWAAEAFEPKK